MAHLTELPDIAKTFARLKIMLDLEEKVNENTLLGMSIKRGIMNKEKPSVIIQTIKDAARDNREAVLNVIPENLLNYIEKRF